jgi:hypothetical protein
MTVVSLMSRVPEVSLALQGPPVSQACPESQAALESTVPMLQDPQAFLVCLGEMGLPGFLAPR